MKNETVERFCGSLTLVDEAEWLKTVFFAEKDCRPQSYGMSILPVNFEH